ncbi:AraC family transcriptional regulator [Staphylococcus nepalensis]|uniref:helix-turn-helix domain-containing protein n=1 Tax=Staphylococcus nepalensis TaxID=214473 RepID=UPI003F4940B5
MSWLSTLSVFIESTFTERTTNVKRWGNPQQVAICCGFTDYSNFYRRFKHSYGCSPRDYLQQYSYSEKMKNQLNIYKTSK